MRKTQIGCESDWPVGELFPDGRLSFLMPSTRKTSARRKKRTPSRDKPPRQSGPVERNKSWPAPRAGLILILVLGAAWAAAVWYRSLEDGPPPESSIQVGRISGRIRFEDRQPRSGIDFVLQNASTEEKPVIDTMLGGVALFDYDNDGFLDIYFTNGARIPALRKDDESFFNRLYRNQGDGTFEDVTLRAGVAGVGYSMGAAAADFNNDGFTDLYVTGVNANTLYQNRGDGTFQDVTGQAGVTGRNAGGAKPWSVAAAWLDFDNDSDLDLFVVNYLDWSWEKNEVCGDPGKRLSCSPVMYGGLANMLFRNEGNGRFTDVSQAAGIAEHFGKAWELPWLTTTATAPWMCSWVATAREISCFGM